MENKEQELIQTIESKIKSEVGNVQTEVNKNAEALKNIENAIAEQGKAIQSIKETKNVAENPKENFRKSLKDASEKLEKQQSGFVTIKTAAAMTEAASITGEVPQSERLPGYNNTVRQQFVLRNIANTGTTNSNLVSWVEQFNEDGAAAATTEGNSKPLIDWEYREASMAVRKIAGRVKVSKEMLQDLPLIEAEINGNLLYKLALAEESGLLSGDGNAPNLKGITTYAQALDLASLAGTVQAANEIDAIGAAITQIYVNGKGQFIPNAIFLNPVDAYKLKSVKNADNSYVMPVYIMPDGMRIMGIQVIETVTVTAGNFLVGDFRFFNIRDKEMTTVQMGYDSDDFSKNMVTIIAEKRLASFVKANDVEAFVYESFADAINFITEAS